MIFILYYQASITVAFSEDWADKFQNAAMSLFSRHDGSSQMICHDRDGNRLRVLQAAGPRFEIDDIPFADKFPLHLRLEQAYQLRFPAGSHLTESTSRSSEFKKQIYKE